MFHILQHCENGRFDHGTMDCSILDHMRKFDLISPDDYNGFVQPLEWPNTSNLLPPEYKSLLKPEILQQKRTENTNIQGHDLGREPRQRRHTGRDESQNPSQHGTTSDLTDASDGTYDPESLLPSRRSARKRALTCPHEGCEYHSQAVIAPLAKQHIFRAQREFTEHLHDAHNESLFPCPFLWCCRTGGKGFSRRRDLLKHQAEHGAASDLVYPESPRSSHETDSTCSADHTDWEEDSMLDIDISAFKDEADMHSPAVEAGDLAVGKEMGSGQIRLIDRLMNEFWKVFNVGYLTHTERGSVNGPSTSSSSISNLSSITSSSSRKHSKRPRGENRDDSDHDSGKDLKRGSSELISDDKVGSSLRFACPYRKRDPRKYSIQAWRRCVLTPHTTVARVKAHLYTYHYIHQCQRCMEVFSSEDELDAHVKAPEPCPPRTSYPVDGITSKMKSRLQCRKKIHRNQTEEDRWFQIYRIIFAPKPEEIIPSPYFEPIRDNEANYIDGQTPQSQDIDSFQGYLRRELPRFFSTVLENAITRELHPIEERLRSELVDLMQEAQNNAFSSWRAMHGIGVHSRHSPAMPTGVEDSVGTSTENASDQAVLDQSLQAQLLSRTFSHGSDSGYNSDPARSRTSQEGLSSSSQEEIDPQMLDNDTVESISSHQTTFDNVANPFNHMHLVNNDLSLSDGITSDALAQERDEATQSVLLYDDYSWAVNSDNLELEYAVPHPSSSCDNGGSYNFAP